MISIINHFSYIVPSFMRYSYRNFKSVHRIKGIFSVFIIFSIVAFITAPTSKPLAIPYNSEARVLCITCLHLVNNQYNMLALFFSSAKMITYLIYNEKSLLLAKDESVNMTSLRKSLLSSSMKINPCDGFSLCQVSFLFNLFILLSVGYIT